MDGVTHELTPHYIEQNPNWITHSTCIVTSNFDRAILNAAAANAFGKRKNVPVMWWKHQLHQDFPLLAQAILNNEDERPELIREVLAKFSTVLMATFTLVSQMALHVQCIHWHGMIQRRNAFLSSNCKIYTSPGD